MRSLNPLEGEFYREALHVSRYTREMFCLMEGRHVHPSTLYPGGVGTTATIQLFTDYLTRLMRYVEFMKKVVPLHDDLFDFFYEALPGYEHVGERRILLGCWGSLNDPEYCDFRYSTMSDWGKKMFVTPGVIVDGRLVTNDLVDINLGIRILLGHSYYEDWVKSGRETFDCYSVASGLLIASIGKQDTPMGSVDVTNLLSDYKDFGGQKVATRLTQQVMGQEQVLRINTVEYDAADPALFEMPAAIKALAEKKP